MTSLRYDYSGALIDETGLATADLESIVTPLAAAQAEVLADVELWNSGRQVPEKKQPLDAAFIDLPERMLATFRGNPAASQLGEIMATSSRLASSVGRVVVLGIGGSYMGARALMEACCHPYYNVLDRDARGGRPQMFFEGNNVDNDASGGRFTESIGRIWSEIKQISKQVERETRKSGRSARLKLDLRRLRRQENEVRARLGKAVYEARGAQGDGISLHEVEGFAGSVAALDALREEIATKQTEADNLRAPEAAAEQPLTESGEVA